MRPRTPGALFSLLAAAAPLLVAGCNSPHHTDRGALFGGLTGAGVGAIIGDRLGDAGAGAALGAGVGTLTGAAIGSEMDEMEARNRALIEARLGRRVAPGAVTMEDVIAMSQAHVADNVIVRHVQAHGAQRPPQTADLIRLKNEGVSDTVVAALQRPPTPPAPATVVAPGPPVIVHEVAPPRPWWHFHYQRGHHHHPRHRPRPRAGWGFSIY